jgi:hypothetical protein
MIDGEDTSNKGTTTIILHKHNLETYFEDVKKLGINDKLKIVEFEDKKELREFVATSLNIANLKLNQKRDYQYEINELNLTYITERIK